MTTSSVGHFERVSKKRVEIVDFLNNGNFLSHVSILDSWHDIKKVMMKIQLDHPFYRFIMMKTKPLMPPGALVGNQFWYPKIQWPSSWKWIWKWPAIIHHQKWPLLLNGPIWEQFLMEDLFSSCYTIIHNGYDPSKTILDLFGI